MKICIIGAGKRTREMYGPVLSSLPQIQVTGIWNRTFSKGEEVAREFSWKCYADLQKMIINETPDALLVVVNSSAIKHVVLGCMQYGIPIITETPVWDKEVPEASNKNNVPVYVNEQTPYLPCENFKMLLLETGLFGSPHVVINDFRTFEFHGISQLRRYVGYEKVPAEVVGSVTHPSMVSYCDNNGKLQNQTETWEFGVIKFDSGQTAVYNFSSIYNRAPFRKPRSMRIYGSRGTIANDDNDFQVNLLKSDGTNEKIHVEVVGAYMSTKQIKAQIGDKEILWEKEDELDHLNDQHMAIRDVLLRNVTAIKLNKPELGYTCASAFMDMNLLNAIRYSAHNKKFLP